MRKDTVMWLRNLITASYRIRVKAVEAYDWLMDIGYDTGDINMLISDEGQEALCNEPGAFQRMEQSLESDGPLAFGAGVRSPAGYTCRPDMCDTLSRSRIPLYGPMLIIGLVGLGMPKNKAMMYDWIIQSGGAVIGVRPKYRNDEFLIPRYFRDSGAENIVGWEHNLRFRADRPGFTSAAWNPDDPATQ